MDASIKQTIIFVRKHASDITRIGNVLINCVLCLRWDNISYNWTGKINVSSSYNMLSVGNSCWKLVGAVWKQLFKLTCLERIKQREQTDDATVNERIGFCRTGGNIFLSNRKENNRFSCLEPLLRSFDLFFMTMATKTCFL